MTAIAYEAGPTAGKPLTLFDKIWLDHLVHSDESTFLMYVDRHLVHEVSSPQAFEGLRNAGRQVRRPDCTLAVADHNVPTDSRKDYTCSSTYIKEEASRTQVAALEEHVVEFGLTFFGLDDKRQGIVHVIGPEQGFTLPGCTLVCGDSHTSTHGAFGAFALGIGTSEVEHVMATQALSFTQRPKNMLISVSGKLGAGISSKDLILHIIGVIGVAGGTGHVIEYCGDAVRDLSMDSRMSMCNMTIEAGARAGLVAPDEKTFGYIKGRPLAPKGSQWEQAVTYWKTLHSDPGALYDKEVHINASDIAPTITWGTNPEAVVPISGVVPDPANEADSAKRASMERMLQYMGLSAGQRMQDIPIQKSFVGSCTNSRIEDLRAAAAIAKGRKVAAGVHAMVVPGSGIVKQQAEAEGLDKIFVEAGFEWREAGCSMCLGMNPDQCAPKERCAATSNRNFEGRQGPGSRTHLMSPAMAAAAAVTGKLTDVRSLTAAAATSAPLCDKDFVGHDVPIPPAPVASKQASDASAGAERGAPKFNKLDNVVAAPLRMTNVDTDCIIPKEFLKTIKRTGLGKGAFYALRYEDDGQTPNKEFVLNQEPYNSAELLIALDNFGCGSSREHAPWALNDLGLKCIVAPSYGDIFFNNCLKNGMLPIVLPKDQVEELMHDAEEHKKMTVDLPTQRITREGGGAFSFEIEAFPKHCLVNGLDDIGLTLQKERFIENYEQLRTEKFPWLDGPQNSTTAAHPPAKRPKNDVTW